MTVMAPPDAMSLCSRMGRVTGVSSSADPVGHHSQGRAVFSLRALMSQRAVYLWVAFASSPVVVLANYIDPTTVYFKGQGASVLIGLASLALSVLLWIPYRSAGQFPRLAQIALGLILTMWLLQTLLIQLDDSLFNLMTFGLPVLMVLVLLKPPSSRDLIVSGWLFAYLLIFVGVLALLLDAMHLTASAFVAQRTGFSRLPILSDLLGIDTRWEGPYGNVNYAAPVGGFLLVFGASVAKPHRVPIILGGLFILVLSQGRAALFATAAGLLVVVLSSKWVSSLPKATMVRQLTVLGALLIGGSYIWLFDRTLALRTDVWSDFLAMWQRSPWLGVGSSGIADYVSEGTSMGLTRQTHGHSIFIDMLTRYGLLMLLLSVAILICILWVSIKAARHGDSMGLALFVFAVVAGTVETTISWSYLGILTVPLVLSLLASGSALSKPCTTSRLAVDLPPCSEPV